MEVAQTGRKVEPYGETLVQGHRGTDSSKLLDPKKRHKQWPHPAECLQITEGKPPLTNSLWGAGPPFDNGKCSRRLAATERCCGPPSGLQEAENKDNFHLLRQTGHTWGARPPPDKTMCHQPFRSAVSCHARLLLLSKLSFLYLWNNTWKKLPALRKLLFKYFTTE